MTLESPEQRRAREDAHARALSAVDRALTPAQRESIIIVAGPSMAGAHVADILDIADNEDTCIYQTEPFYERGDAGAIVRELYPNVRDDGETLEPEQRVIERIVALSAIACALLVADHVNPPTLNDVRDLALKAAALRRPMTDTSERE